MRPRHPSRLTATALAVALTVTALAGAAAPVTAAPEAATSEAAEPAAAPTGGSTTRVTLVTGDVVDVTTAGGKTSVAVAAADGGAVEAYELDGDTYVVPAGVAPLVRAGTVDDQLFNVTRLIESGYADDAAAELPVIVTYDGTAARSASAGADAVAARAESLPASDATLPLPSIDGAAVEVAKADAGTFWAAVQADRSVDAIWLDGAVAATLDVSVPMIGAPEAWASGLDGTGTTVAVLDTGVDPAHPDVAGQLTVQQDFTGGNSPVDRHGHGTHVAATVAGTGAGSDGARRGVAPGADLMIGKVLDDGGSGQDSWVIAGMEWAARGGADVVSMSLGGYASDGTDPLSQAVNELTAETGALFVIAGGNYGPGDYSLTNPGAADAALTVGNVTKTDELAATSGRGPRVGDHAVKPDITAPGTNIVAARAAGTAMGTPVDDLYTSASGTSMATPHVAGAAAIVRQQHPDWTPEQVKAALVSTAVPRDGLTVYQQGGGRLDVATAVGQGVFAGPAPLNFGYLPYPQTDLEPIVRTVTFSNVTDATVTLDLAASASAGPTPAPAGMLTLGAPAVTVPANGTATVDVTLDPSLGAAGLYSGFVTGIGPDGVSVSLPLGLNKEQEVYELTVTVLDREGEPNRGATVQVGNVDDSSKHVSFPNLDARGQATVRVPPGTYSVLSIMNETDGERYTYTFAGDPEVEVEPGGASVVLDGRTAVPVTADVGRTVEGVFAKLEFWRFPLAGEAMHYRYLLGEPFTDVYATPTDEVTEGGFHLVTQFSLAEPDIVVDGAGLAAFEPEYFVYAPELPEGPFRRDVVDAGTATPSELAEVDLDGKIALVEAANGQWSEQIRAVAAAGAELAFLYSRAGYPFSGAVERGLPIPAAALDLSEAETLLARGGDVTVHSTPDSPYLYDLRFDQDGAVGADLSYVVDPDDLATVSSTYHADATQRTVADVNPSFAPWQDNSFDSYRYFRAPIERTEYVTASPGMLWLKQLVGYETDEVVLARHARDRLRTLSAGEELADTWFGGPFVPSPRREVLEQDRVGMPCPACRDADELFFWIEDFTDSGDGHYGAWDIRWENSATRLFRDDQLVVSRRTGRGVLAAVAADSEYRLEIDAWSDAPWSFGTRSSTAWTFRSAAPASGVGDLPPQYACTDRGHRDCAFLPLLFASYDVPLDPLNRAPAGRAFQFGLTVGGQVGAPAPSVRRVRVEVSYDDGASWRPAVVRPAGGAGAYTVTVRHPKDAEHVSLRIDAQGDGTRLEQEVLRAYPLD
ncbi:S8 family serine peptidase [Jiangella alkaliphila]|uniref:Serine protease, subtilisin family n=1 Tax=Jiangella alkaliphila TaxID=419479 RepID=A0A1H2G8H0_9ACTN|nr:S8 family serine peptidase [Jiangella alkaliphila]SDU15862.1 Serine protease, subtilisin family [Jiangella alkaliphila]